MNTFPHPIPTPPEFAPSHKPQKPSKESGIFQSLGTTCSFLLKGKVKRRGAMAQCPPKYDPEAMTLVKDQIKTVVEDVLRVCIPPA